MATTSTTTVKRTTRARKSASSLEATSVDKTTPSLPNNLKAYENIFTDLFRSINEAKEEFIGLQKEIDEIRESWRKEQKDHEMAILERNQQEEIGQKREKETYHYETMLARKKSEDEFLEKKQNGKES